MAVQLSSTNMPMRTALSTSSTLRSTGSRIPELNNGPILASWERAIELFNQKLTRDEKKKIDLKKCHSASFEELLKAAGDAKDRAELKRFGWTPTVQKIFKLINRYAVAGDIIAQYDTQYTAIAWGTFRFLLSFAVEEGTTAEKLSEALSSVIQIVLRAQEYAALFSAHSGSSTAGVFSALQDNLTHLYAEVLNFLVRATIFFNKPTLRRYISAGFSPFDTQFRSILDRVDKLESNVGKDVSLLNAEAENQRQENEDGVWLNPADFSTRLDDLKRRHLSGTCEWFLQSATYRTWRDSSKIPQNPNLLWVHGKPGCGKSVLAAQIILDLKSSTDHAVPYVFCKSGEENKSDFKDILRNVIHQVLCGASASKPLIHQIVRFARLNAKTPSAQDMGQLWSLLQKILETGTPVYCIIDGLDECSGTPEEQMSFLNRLSDMFHSAKATTKLAVISRLGTSELSNPSVWSNVQIESSDVREDIVLFVLTKLQDSRVLNRHREKDRLQEELVKSSDGMILWAELMIQELEAGCWDVDRVLRNPPKGLRAVYEAIFRRLSTPAAVTDVQHVLQLLLVAARPLRLDELAIGLALLKGLRHHEDYSRQGNPDEEGKAIIRKSTPLITVMPDKTVQLIHSSLREFLLETTEEDRNAVDSVSKNFRFQTTKCHDILAPCLITYLSFECFNWEIREEESEEEESEKEESEEEESEEEGSEEGGSEEGGSEGEESEGEESEGGETLFIVNALLKYSTLHLILHFTQAPPSTELAGRLVSFFQSRHGWRWLQRLEAEDGISFGHLQVMQSDLKSWSSSSSIDHEFSNILGGFLLLLAEKRHEYSKALPIEHKIRLHAMSTLARSYRDHGEYNRAEELQVQVMETCKKVLGAEHPGTLNSIFNLASTYRGQGRWTEAETLFVQVLKARKKVLGAEHPWTVISISDLALTYRNQGRWAEAETLQVQELKTSKKLLGMEHPDTLMSISNLAITYWSQGRWTEAEKLGIQALETSKKILGMEHPDTLTSINNLALTYWNQGRWTEAEKLGIQGLKTSKKILGMEHPATLITIANLASTYSAQGRRAEAEKLKVQVLKTNKRILGVEHPETLTIIANLALTYSTQGRRAEAEKLAVQVLKTKRRVLGAKHPGTLISMNNLAHTYKRLGRHDEAVDLMKEVIDLSTQAIGANHPNTLNSINDLNEWQAAEVQRLQQLGSPSVCSLASEETETDLLDAAEQDQDQDQEQQEEQQEHGHEQPQQGGSPSVCSSALEETNPEQTEPEETDPLHAAEREQRAAWVQNLLKELAEGKEEEPDWLDKLVEEMVERNEKEAAWLDKPVEELAEGDE